MKSISDGIKMTYKILEENPAFGAGKEYGKYMAKQLMPHTVKKREIYLSENRVFINDGYVVFNIIELDEYAGKITVNINNQGKHSIDTFPLCDINGCVYFEYGRPIPEKIYLSDFKEIT